VGLISLQSFSPNYFPQGTKILSPKGGAFLNTRLFNRKQSLPLLGGGTTQILGFPALKEASFKRGLSLKGRLLFFKFGGAQTPKPFLGGETPGVPYNNMLSSGQLGAHSLKTAPIGARSATFGAASTF